MISLVEAWRTRERVCRIELAASARKELDMLQACQDNLRECRIELAALREENTRLLRRVPLELAELREENTRLRRLGARPGASARVVALLKEVGEDRGFRALKREKGKVDEEAELFVGRE